MCGELRRRRTVAKSDSYFCWLKIIAREISVAKKIIDGKCYA